MRYPEKEDERIALSRAIFSGLTKNSGVFPNPPITIANGEAKIAEYDADRADADDKTAQAQLAIQKKDATLDQIDDNSKTVLSWAERLTGDDDAKLKLLGWGARRPPVKMPPPSQPTYFEILKQGDGWGYFDWKEPKGGGKVASYILRRSEDGENFTDVKTVIPSEVTVYDQPTGKKLWFHVVAINGAGESEASNSVVVAL